MPVWLHGPKLVLGPILIYFLICWFLDLWFYKKQNWNYLIDNPNAGHIYKGRMITEAGKLSNRSRVYFGYPFFILILSVLLIGDIYIDLKI